MKKKALSFAVGAALVLGASQVQSDQLLFPYFESGNGSFTFLSLRGDGNGGPFAAASGGAAGNFLHYVFNYDDPVLGACTHFDVQGSWTSWDLIQQTVAAPGFPGGLDLNAAPFSFGDVSGPAHLPFGPTEGFLTVRDDSGEGSLGGQAIIVNALTGLVTAYRGINNPAATPSSAQGPVGGNWPDGDFSLLAVTSHLSHDLTWYPRDHVDTQWFVLVTGGALPGPTMTDPNGWNGRVNLFHGFGGVLNRDEVFLSGQVSRNITCYDFINPDDFMNAAQRNSTRNGGWTWLASLPVSGNARGTLMYKIESTAALGGATAISQENPFPNLF